MKEEKKVKGRRRYDAEFKLNVLEMHKNGRSVPSLAASFGINENIIYRWKKRRKPHFRCPYQVKRKKLSGYGSNLKKWNKSEIF